MEKKNGNLLRRDWKKLSANAKAKLVCRGIGYGVSIAGGPIAVATTVILDITDFIVQKFMDTFESGELNMSEVMTGSLAGRYESVGKFWTQIEHDGIENGSPVEITGLFSPFGPLIPAHPMSRPGYTVEGWEAIGDLRTEDTEEYDTRDSLIFGDRIIRLTSPRKNKFYAGLYDLYYGLSNVGLPLLVDISLVKKKNHGLYSLWNEPFSPGKAVRIKGNIIELSNPYSKMEDLPIQYSSLPNFGLEVTEILSSDKPRGVTHVTASVGWKKRDSDESMLSHYFNVQNPEQFRFADSLLQEKRSGQKKSLIFDYDNLNYLSAKLRMKLPLYNELLTDWLSEK